MTRQLWNLARALAASAFVGMVCGAVLGVAVCFFWGMGPMAVVFGVAAGAYFGILGGLLGGMVGWAVAGLVAGVAIGNYSFGLFEQIDSLMYMPSVAFMLVGFVIGSPDKEQSNPVLFRWMNDIRGEARLLKVLAIRVLLAFIALGWNANIIWERMVVPIQKNVASRDMSDGDRLDYE